MPIFFLNPDTTLWKTARKGPRLAIMNKLPILFSDNQLIVRGFEKLEQLSPEDSALTFARTQLTTYGFHSSRVNQALESSEVINIFD